MPFGTKGGLPRRIQLMTAPAMSYICLVLSSHVYMIVFTGLYVCQHWFICLPILPTLFICLVVFPSYTSSCIYMYDCNHIFVKLIFISDYIHSLMRFLCQHSTLSTQVVGNGNVFLGLALLLLYGSFVWSVAVD